MHYLHYMYHMAKKAQMSVRIDPELKAWMKDFNKDRRRGLSGFVEDACLSAKRKVDRLK